MGLQWEDGTNRTSGFKRGSETWWREQYYEYEYTGQGGVQSMSAVREALDVLEVRLAKAISRP